MKFFHFFYCILKNKGTIKYNNNETNYIISTLLNFKPCKTLYKELLKAQLFLINHELVQIIFLL